MPLLLDVSHTSHTRARTGIQRVVRSLAGAMGEEAVPVTFDPYASAWRPLEPWEQSNLSADGAARSRGAKWPVGARLRGRWRRLLGRTASAGVPSVSGGVLVPEIFSPEVAAALPRLFDATTGPRVAVFHDAIALKLPELTPAKTVARFPAYLQELRSFDGIAAVSQDSHDSLVDFWRWAGVSRMPEVRTIPLGIDVPPRRALSVPTAGSDTPIVLTVGSLEGRKNHRALFDACEQLWARGVRFELHVLGIARPETATAALERLAELRRTGRPVRHDGSADDRALEAAYDACAFTVYPSLLEGFGLPVLESVARGKPCVCSARGALGEAARGGGCIALPDVGPASLAAAIERLVTDRAERDALAAAARTRKLRTWADYANELGDWMRSLRRRAA